MRLDLRSGGLGMGRNQIEDERTSANRRCVTDLDAVNTLIGNLKCFRNLLVNVLLEEMFKFCDCCCVVFVVLLG